MIADLSQLEVEPDEAKPEQVYTLVYLNLFVYLFIFSSAG